MSKLKLLKISVTLLVMLNMVLIVLIAFPNKHKHRRGPKHHIIRVLDFNEQQIQRYELLITDHRSQVRALEKQLTQLKQNLYTEGLTEQSITDPTHFRQVGQLHQELESVHLQHFQAIKALCTPDQLPAFEQLSRDFAHMFHPHPKRRKK